MKSTQKLMKIRGSPTLLVINFDGLDIEKIESHLKFWKCLFIDKIDQTQFQWWKMNHSNDGEMKRNVAEY